MSEPYYPYEWIEGLTQSIGSSLQFKRSKRLYLPGFYSSDTVHLLNRVKTNQNVGQYLHASLFKKVL